MLNKETNTRELAYVVRVDKVMDIPGRDRVECACVGGWTCMVPKGIFQAGDLGIYFEIDSKLPEKEPFLFLERKHYKIKTQKFKTPNGHFYSQGLLMHPTDFGWTQQFDYIDTNGACDETLHEGDYLTEALGVTYAVANDNKRKSTPKADKYAKMARRHGKLFSHQPFRWLMKRDWGKKMLFFFFGRQRDKRAWPDWVQKTDEERIENMTWILQDKQSWVATEKIDGTSTTFTARKGTFKKEYIVCSRNVMFEDVNQPCYYDTNVYVEMFEKYNIKKVLDTLLDTFKADWVTIQGETYGDSIQKRNYGLKNGEHKFCAFNLVVAEKGRLGTITMRDILIPLGVPCVPVVDAAYILPDTIEELREFVDSETSKIDDEIREGIVFRAQDGRQSFKCVSPEYLQKYHG